MGKGSVWSNQRRTHVGRLTYDGEWMGMRLIRAMVWYMACLHGELSIIDKMQMYDIDSVGFHLGPRAVQGRVADTG